MKTLTLLLLLLAGAYSYPFLNEDVSSNCQAVEVKLLSLSDLPMPKLLAGLSQGEFGKNLAKREFSELPPQVGCAVAYWNIWLQKDKYRNAIFALIRN